MSSKVSALFTAYERKVLREIALHRVQPNAVEWVLETLGRPVRRLLRVGTDSNSVVVRTVSDQIHGWIEEGLIQTIKIANRLTRVDEVLKRFALRGFEVKNPKGVRRLPLEHLDSVANSFSFGSTVLLGAEGAVLGVATTFAGSVPGAQLVIPSLVLTDITSSMALLSRHACRISTTYGYSSRLKENVPHLIAAMAPQTKGSDEGYVALKAAVMTSIGEAGQFAARSAATVIDRQLLEREAPQMVRLISTVSERLGVVITQKELGLLIPIAGAVVNGSINMAFQRVGHTTAQDYFRRLVLEDRYGEDIVAHAIRQETDTLRK